MRALTTVLAGTLACTALGASALPAQTYFFANFTMDQELSVAGPTTISNTPRPVPYGTATFVLNASMTSLFMQAVIYNIDVTGSQTADTYDNLSAAHIHASSDPAFTPPANAPVVFGFFGAPFNDNNPNDFVVTPFLNGVGGTFVAKWDAAEGNNTTLTAQLPNILAGRSYVNFHTVQNPGGEIRGAISTIPEPASLVLLGSGLAALGALRRRRRRSA